MKENLILKNGIGTILYRIRRYPGAALISLGLALVMAFLLCYLAGRVYPDFQLFNNLSSKIGMAHDEQYNFYSGEDGGTYYRIGEAIEGPFQDDGDVIHNCRTGEANDNTWREPFEGTTFVLNHRECMRDSDRLQNKCRVVVPFFRDGVLF